MTAVLVDAQLELFAATGVPCCGHERLQHWQIVRLHRKPLDGVFGQCGYCDCKQYQEGGVIAVSPSVERVFRRLNLTSDGVELETRARCQDDGHPVGAVHPYWFGPGDPGSFCHCGRIVYHGALPVDEWPRPEPKRRERPVFR